MCWQAPAPHNSNSDFSWRVCQDPPVYLPSLKFGAMFQFSSRNFNYSKNWVCQDPPVHLDGLELLFLMVTWESTASGATPQEPSMCMSMSKRMSMSMSKKKYEDKPRPGDLHWVAVWCKLSWHRCRRSYSLSAATQVRANCSLSLGASMNMDTNA